MRQLFEKITVTGCCGGFPYPIETRRIWIIAERAAFVLSGLCAAVLIAIGIIISFK